MEKVNKPRKWRMPGRPIKIDPAKNNVMVDLYREYGVLLNETGKYTQGLDYYHKAMDELDKLIVTEEDCINYRLAYIHCLGISHIYRRLG